MITGIAMALLMQTVEQKAPCRIAEAGVLIDGRYDAKARETATRIARGSPVRWLLPGSSVTQDYQPQRLNLEVGDDGVVHKAWCG